MALVLPHPASCNDWMRCCGGILSVPRPRSRNRWREAWRLCRDLLWPVSGC